MTQGLVIGKYTLESLTTGMYSSPLDMYREYIQNAVDSFDEIIKGGFDRADRLYVDIKVDKNEDKISIYDNGGGIKAEEAVSALLNIGNSQKNHNITRGFRGIGRLAGLSYCRKLTFKTSYKGEGVSTKIEFDSDLLKQLLSPGESEVISVEEVIDKITHVFTEKEETNCSYFHVILDGIFEETELTDINKVRDYLVQHAPLPFSKEFKWGSVVTEKIKIGGYKIPQYKIVLNGEKLFKPYLDEFLSDRVKRNVDLIQDIKVETFYRGNKISAFLWYAQTNFYGTILDNSIKGIRIRQGNILVGDKGSCSHFFKEERFNSWMIGELYLLDQDIIVNSRRDGFEKNSAFYELEKNLKKWALNISKEIRHISYSRSLSEPQKTITEAESLEDVDDINDLCSEGPQYIESLGESDIINQSESDELAETDYISKLSLLLDQKKAQTKYTALNVNAKLTSEQRKVLERVFDIITNEYDKEIANQFVDIISKEF